MAKPFYYKQDKNFNRWAKNKNKELNSQEDKDELNDFEPIEPFRVEVFLMNNPKGTIVGIRKDGYYRIEMDDKTVDVNWVQKGYFEKIDNKINKSIMKEPNKYANFSVDKLLDLKIELVKKIEFFYFSTDENEIKVVENSQKELLEVKDALLENSNRVAILFETKNGISFQEIDELEKNGFFKEKNSASFVKDYLGLTSKFAQLAKDRLFEALSREFDAKFGKEWSEDGYIRYITGNLIQARLARTKLRQFGGNENDYLANHDFLQEKPKQKPTITKSTEQEIYNENTVPSIPKTNVDNAILYYGWGNIIICKNNIIGYGMVDDKISGQKYFYTDRLLEQQSDRLYLESNDFCLVVKSGTEKPIFDLDNNNNILKKDQNKIIDFYKQRNAIIFQFNGTLTNNITKSTDKKVVFPDYISQKYIKRSNLETTKLAFEKQVGSGSNMGRLPKDYYIVINELADLNKDISDYEQSVKSKKEKTQLDLEREAFNERIVSFEMKKQIAEPLIPKLIELANSSKGVLLKTRGVDFTPENWYLTVREASEVFFTNIKLDVKAEFKIENAWYRENIYEFIYWVLDDLLVKIDNIPKSTQKTTIPEKKYELGFGFMGSGTTVWNRLDIDRESKDYRIIAHIKDYGAIDYYEKNLPKEVIAKIESMNNNFPIIDINNGTRSIEEKDLLQMEQYLEKQPQTKELHTVDGKYTADRQALHKAIIAREYDDIVCQKSTKPIAIMMGGLPASGKSTFLKKHYDWALNKAIFKIDADEIRAQLPEYKGWNADITHAETQDIVKQLIKLIAPDDCKFDFIYDGTMTNYKKYKELMQHIKSLGYDIYAIFLQIDEKNSLKRMLGRYQNSGRYVPRSVIYENAPIGQTAFRDLQSLMTGWILVDGITQEILEKGGKELPQDRNYGKLDKESTVEFITNKLIKRLEEDFAGHELETIQDNIFFSDKKYKSLSEKEQLEVKANLFQKYKRQDYAAANNLELPKVAQKPKIEITKYLEYCRELVVKQKSKH